MTASATDVAVEPRFESRCKVCSSGEGSLPNAAAVRHLADQLLMVPKPYPEVVRLLAPLMADWPEESRFSKYSLRRHAQRHLRWEETALRVVADRRASHSAQVGEVSQRMLDATVVLETIRQRGLDLLLQDQLRPSVKDLLAATAALQELEDEADAGLSPAVLLSQLDVVIQVIREEIPEDRWEHVVARLEGKTASPPLPPASDPVFDELQAEMDAMGR
jgi:hypothetical protein